MLEEHADKIVSTEDLMAFRSRYPDLYDRTLHEEPIDNSDTLVAQMDRTRHRQDNRPGAAGCG